MDWTVETFLNDHGFAPIELECPACQTQSLHTSKLAPGSDLAHAGIESFQMTCCVTCGCVELRGDMSAGHDEHHNATDLAELRFVLAACMRDLVGAQVH